MSSSGRRVQVRIDDELHHRITAAARARGVSAATVVREAIDRGLPGSINRRNLAGQRLLDAPDMDVPEVVELRRELDAAYRSYDGHPVEEPDEWGDLASWRRAAGAS